MVPIHTEPVSTWLPPAPRSGAAWLSSRPPADQKAFLDGLGEEALLSLPWLWEFWALPHQLPPAGDWKTWVVLGGRGAGKTRAGAEWVRGQVEGARPHDPGRSRRVALVAETLDQARDIMVLGESGLVACSPPDRRPVWHSTRRLLVWPNGAEAQIFSAHDPESLRGPQFDCAWSDELAKWTKGDRAWSMLQFGLRLGEDPRQTVTTTPRNVPTLKDLLVSPSTVATHAATEANRANLAGSFLDEIRSRFGGSQLGRQELDGVLLEDVDGALWTREMLDAGRVDAVPALDRVVVAVDPSVAAGPDADECGIVVAGAVTRGPLKDWRAFVLEDATVPAASAMTWARAAIAAFRRHESHCLVAEVNQGGDLVGTVLRQVDPLLPYRSVHARSGKAARAEPVAALYEQRRVHHLRSANLARLEDQMCAMTRSGYLGRGSPDRVDALVWALTDLILEPAHRLGDPVIRSL